MDCLHGVLMHGDNQQGDNHGAEDVFNVLQAKDSARGKSSGPCEGMDCLHGVLMHNDDHQGQAHQRDDDIRAQRKSGPKAKPEKQGPCQGMDCLHGVLMHGDEQHGNDHAKEDAKKVETDPEKKQRGPCEGMDCLHGVLMHGDEEQGDAHAQDHAHMRLKHEKVQFGVESADSLLHADGDDAHDVIEPATDDDVSMDDVEADADTAAAAKEDFQQYAAWKKEQTEEKSKDGALWGFSLPFISDTGDSDSDFMKWKYLAKVILGGEDEELVEEPASHHDGGDM